MTRFAKRARLTAMQIVDLTLHLALGRNIAFATGHPVAAPAARSFKGRQHQTRALVSVRGADVRVVLALHAPDATSANGSPVRMLVCAATFCDRGAAGVTVVAPWRPHARKDRATTAHDADSLRHVTQRFDTCLMQSGGRAEWRRHRAM